jgi:hypothetical protein
MLGSQLKGQHHARKKREQNKKVKFYIEPSIFLFLSANSRWHATNSPRLSMLYLYHLINIISTMEQHRNNVNVTKLLTSTQQESNLLTMSVNFSTKARNPFIIPLCLILLDFLGK